MSIENSLPVNLQTCKEKPNAMQNNVKNTTNEGFLELLQFLFACEYGGGAGKECMQAKREATIDLKQRPSNIGVLINQIVEQVTPESPGDFLTEPVVIPQEEQITGLSSVQWYDAAPKPTGVQSPAHLAIPVVETGELFDSLPEMAAGRQAGAGENLVHTGESKQSLHLLATLAQMNLFNLNYSQLSKLFSPLQNVHENDGALSHQLKLFHDTGLSNNVLAEPEYKNLDMPEKVSRQLVRQLFTGLPGELSEEIAGKKSMGGQSPTQMRTMPGTDTQVKDKTAIESINGEQLKPIFSDKKNVLPVNSINQEKFIFNELRIDTARGQLTHGDMPDEAAVKNALNTYDSRSVNNLSENKPVKEAASQHRQPNFNGVVFNSDGSAAASKPAGAEAPATTRPENTTMYMQLAEAIKGRVNKDSLGQTHVRLQLHPQNLGEVTIKLVYRDGNINAHFQAASEQAKQIIESSLPQLRETLASFQLSLHIASVSVGQENGRWGQDGNQGRNSKKQRSIQIPKAGFVSQSHTGAAIAAQQGNENRLNYFV